MAQANESRMAQQTREPRQALLDQGKGNDEMRKAPMLDWRGDPVRVNEYGMPEIWTYEPPEMPRRPEAVQAVREKAFLIFLILIFGGSCVLLLITFILSVKEGDQLMGIACSKEWKMLFKYTTIPLVSVIFTWWHVWLGIKMCFYPVEFKGCCFPVCGWQGIVPRRAEVMANRSCDIMIGRLFNIEEIIDRIDPESFFEELQPALVDTSAAVLYRLAQERCPGIWEKLPEDVKDELQQKIIEVFPLMFGPIINDVKANINQIVDIKQCAIEILMENKPLMVEMFQKIGEREFTFIQHFSAVLGFLLGLFQMSCWMMINAGHDEAECLVKANQGQFHCWAGFLVLPLSGLIIGYLTNWLGINLIFRPVWPHICCGGYINFQGVFLKRQQSVSYEMTKMICSSLVTSRKIIEYVMRKEELLNIALGMFRRHVGMGIDISTAAVGPMVDAVAGQGVLVDMKDDVMRLLLDEIPNHSKPVEDYMDRRFDLVSMISYRLSHLPPSDFEGMLHPVFQEDEWMVLVLGGVLGVVVGTGQAWLLGA